MRRRMAIVAMCCKTLKRPEAAIASYDKAIGLRPDYAEAYANRGNALRDLKHPDEALASYDTAIALKPDYAEAHNNRGMVLQDLKRPDEAIASYEKAIALKSDYAQAYSNRGNTLRTSGVPGRPWRAMMRRLPCSRTLCRPTAPAEMRCGN